MGIVSRRVDKRQVEAMWKLVRSLRVKNLNHVWVATLQNIT